MVLIVAFVIPDSYAALGREIRTGRRGVGPVV
jgi:hypothetical protein